MKTKNLLTFMLMTMFSLSGIVFTSCSNDDDDAKSLQFSVDKLVISPTVEYKITIENGTPPYTAKSVNEGAAAVNVDGNVMTIKGIKPGRTSIIVSDKNKLSGTIPVKVLLPLLFDKLEVKMVKGEVVTFQIKSGEAPYKVQVRDRSIASVSIRGNVVTVKRLKAGMTSITVTDSDENSSYIAVIVR